MAPGAHRVMRSHTCWVSACTRHKASKSLGLQLGGVLHDLVHEAILLAT